MNPGALTAPDAGRVPGEVDWAAPATSGGPIDRTFRAMGCDVRIVVSDPGGARSAEELVAAVMHAEALVHACDARLTRFAAGSELCRLADDPAETVTVSPLLAHALDEALRAAETSGGLLDPTMPRALASAGYAADWDPGRRAGLTDLLAAAPPRRAAGPAPRPRWREVRVDLPSRTVTRPPGVAFDLGATAKGFIADLALRALGEVDEAFVDAGGDVAIHATAQQVLAADPFGGEPVAFQVAGPCGVATSSIAGRCWIGDDGPAHHLLDPRTGRPAFTGVVQVTAIGSTTVEAERLAGQALLSGPVGAMHLLAEHGGLIVLDDGFTHCVPGGRLR